MIKLFDWLRVRRERRILKYIGKVEVTMTETDDDGGTRTLKASILFFMSEDGKREIKLPEEKSFPAKWQSLRYFQSKDWEKGGAFPDDFIPEADVLGPMLRRIVDINMGLVNND